MHSSHPLAQRRFEARHVKLIASDLDGTLFGPDHTLTERTIAAVRAAHRAGIRVVAATGRSSTSAVPRLRPATVITSAVCSNGSLVHDVVGDATLHRFHMDSIHVERFFHLVSALDVRHSFSWETDHGNGWDESFADIAFTHDDLGDTPTLPGRPEPHHRTTKLMVYHPAYEQDELRERLLPHLVDPLNVSCSGVEFVEVTGAGVDKSTGLSHLCEQWSIDASEVVAFGDNHNDVGMLTWAGHGVAMGNAAAPALDAADEVIGDHRDDAVARYIESLLEARS